MASDALNAFIALNRFGLGAKPGSLSAAAPDPRGFLKEEAKSNEAALIDGELPTTKIALQQMFVDQERRREERDRAAGLNLGSTAKQMAAREIDARMASDAPTRMPSPADANPTTPERNVEQALFRSEALLSIVINGSRCWPQP